MLIGGRKEFNSEKGLTRKDIDRMNRKTTDENLEKFLSDLHSTSQSTPQGTPRYSTFSGDPAPSKGEVSYDQWVLEVKSTRGHYPEAIF